MKVLHLIPMPLVLEGTHDNISIEVRKALTRVDLIVAEKARTCRRFLRQLVPELEIEKKRIVEIDKSGGDQAEVMEMVKQHSEIGLVSEAGCPGIADPGNFLVKYAHQKGAQVRALSGPSSIFMALMASGFNGQQFSFHGYLPRDKRELSSKLKSMEAELNRKNYTQLFMETPYRNRNLIEVMFQSLRAETLLHISAGITEEKSLIKTQQIIQWKREPALDLHKVPAIFVLGKYGGE